MQPKCWKWSVWIFRNGSSTPRSKKVEVYCTPLHSSNFGAALPERSLRSVVTICLLNSININSAHSLVYNKKVQRVQCTKKNSRTNQELKKKWDSNYAISVFLCPRHITHRIWQTFILHIMGLNATNALKRAFRMWTLVIVVVYSQLMGDRQGFG